MSKQSFSPGNLTLALFILLVATVRILSSTSETISPMSNFTPIGAMALFGGAYFAGPAAFLFPLLTLWVSDLVLGKLVFYHEWKLFYEGFYWTYGAFALMTLVGKFLKPNQSILGFVSSSLIIVFIHWIVSDLGVWLEGTMYPKTLAGWIACLIAAIPFERNFLAGTLIYGTVMFGGFEYLKSKIPSLSLAKA